MNEIQAAAYAIIREAICGSVSSIPVRYNAIKVITPFLDWIGEPVSIYITCDGSITDGEKTLNQIKALRAYDEFNDWPERATYFEDYNINPIGNSLDIQYKDSPEDILRYIQGVSRLPILFEVDPLSDKEDKFPTTVKNDVMENLMSEYPNRPKEDSFGWARKIASPYSFLTTKGIRIHSDMRPVNKNKNVQIIGMLTSSDSAKRAHIASKLYNPLCWEKTNHNVQTIVIIYDTSKYPKDSQDAINEEAEIIIEYKKGKSAIEMICQEVAEA